MNTLAAYVVERFPPLVFGPALLLLTAAALWASTSPLGADSALVSLLGLMLIAQFRVWDDLEDVERDRIRHPERVIVNAPPSPFRILLLLLGCGAALLCLRRPAALLALAALDIAFWLAYRHLRVVMRDATWRNGVLLLKYPAFIAVMSLTRGAVDVPQLLAAMAAAYVSAYAYELWHDPSQRRAFALSQRQASAFSQRQASAFPQRRASAFSQRRASAFSQRRASALSQRRASARRDPGASS